MHIIEKCWVELSQGYQTAKLLESRLVLEWSRAVQVAQKRELLADRIKKKRFQKISGIVFSAVIFLCALLYSLQLYFPENQLQILLYQCLLILPGITAGILFFTLLQN